MAASALARLRHLTIHCSDPYELASFWAQMLGGSLHPDDQPGDPEALVTWHEYAPALLFVHVERPSSDHGRLHLDLQPVGLSRDEAVERVLELGGRLVADRRRPDGQGWATMADPEGNVFCVERSASERAATG